MGMKKINATVKNKFADNFLCYISVGWHILGTLLIVIWMLSSAPSLQTPSFVFLHFQIGSTFSSARYVGVIEILFSASWLRYRCPCG
jgi:hypothetical protein